MSINQQQFEQLTEIGISLWQRRTNENNELSASNTFKRYARVDLKQLTEQQLFTDILLATGLSIGEISNQGDHLDLGLFNWYFTASEHEQNINKVDWHEQRLITPSITNISLSPELKKQLWKILSKQINE